MSLISSNILRVKSCQFESPVPSVLQLQSSVTEFEFSQEEYRQLQVEFWSKFYACCLQYQEALSMPLGLSVSQHTNMVCVLKKVTEPSGHCVSRRRRQDGGASLPR